MNERSRTNILGIYDLFLSSGAIITGILMASENYGIFAEGFPKEWLSVLPFKSWVIPGIIAIVVFGLGNMLAAVFSLKRKGDRPWMLSIVMSFIFLISLIVQIMLLGEWYLATVQFLGFGIIQLCIGIYAYAGDKKMI